MKIIIKGFILFVTLFTLTSCDNEDDSLKRCSDNPLEEIKWLKELVDNENNTNNSMGLEIIEYVYKGQTVFMVDNCINNCSDSLVTVYDCEKNILCEFGGIAGLNTCPDFDSEAINKKILFSTRIKSDKCNKSVIIDAELFKKIKATTDIKAKIEGNCIYIQFQHNFCSVTPPNSLVDSGLVLKSLPVQRRLKFNVAQIKPTSCDKVITENVSFDISSLATWDNPVVILNIEGLGPIKYTRAPQCGDPNINCVSDRNADLLELKKMFSELNKLSESVVCENASDWKFTAFGSKACGGPQGFLPYSIKIDVAAFLKKVSIYTKAEATFNKKWHVVSTCELLVAPSGVSCKEGKPVFL